MKPRQRIVIGAIVLLSGAAGFAAGRALFRPTQRVVQPIAFNHYSHVEDLGIECDYCHDLYATSAHSGLPGLALCLECHEDALTEQAEEQKIRDLAARGENDVFRKLFRVPDHTFFSHRRHVAIADLPCETCHGEVAQTRTPPELPLVRVTMDFCLECHAEQGVSGDCTRCHR